MSAQWDDLPEEVRAELTREGVGPETPEELEARIRDLKEQGRHLTMRIKAAMAHPLDPSVFHGAPEGHRGLPNVVHGEVIHPDGAAPTDEPTREEGTALPDLPHGNDSQTDHGPDENASQPTPEQRRAAWVNLHRHMVLEAERALRSSRELMPYAVRHEIMSAHLAQEWAALQLLRSLQGLPAPEVPVDHAKDQPTLEEALTYCTCEGRTSDMEAADIHFSECPQDNAWVCHCGYEGHGPDASEWYAHSIVCPLP